MEQMSVKVENVFDVSGMIFCMQVNERINASILIQWSIRHAPQRTIKYFESKIIQKIWFLFSKVNTTLIKILRKKSFTNDSQTGLSTDPL